jgi:hypothetical protein
VVLFVLDGMPADWLERWLAEGRFLPGQAPADPGQVKRGLWSRLAAGARAASLRPDDPPVTALNVAALLTGVPVSVHGILANRFLHAGVEVNGFRHPVGAETIWQAALRQGRRVVTWRALGSRCEGAVAAGHRALCFPHPRERMVVQSTHRVPLDPAAPPTILGRSPVPEGVPRLAVRARAVGAGVRLELPAGARVTRGPAGSLSPGDTVAIQWRPKPAPGAAAVAASLDWETLVTLLDQEPGGQRARLYHGGTTTIHAQPPTFRRALQDGGVFLPLPVDDDGFLRRELEPRRLVETALPEVDAVVRLGRLLARADDLDLAVIYLGAIDALGHDLLFDPGRTDLAPGAAQRALDALEAGLRVIDLRLAALLDALDPARYRWVVASDHGMAPVHTDVSLRAAVLRVAPTARVTTSAASGHVYLGPGGGAARVARYLRQLQVEGRKVFAGGRVVHGRARAQVGLAPAQADLLVQAGPGFTLSSRRVKPLAGRPRYAGQHGQPAGSPGMAGVLLVVGPGVAPGRFDEARIREVPAVVAEAARLSPPPRAEPARRRWFGGEPAVAAPGQ